MAARDGEGRREEPRLVPAIVLALVAAGLLAVHLDRPGFFDNEGRYAEVAREMLGRGDFVTPQMDSTLFLNKPPLTYWVAAAAYAVVGVSEWARLAVVLASAVTIVVTCRLGARLFSAGTGLLAGFMLATMLGFVLEARTLRPDAILIATVAGALLCWLHAEAAGARQRTSWLVAAYAVLGVGVMAKGVVPLLLVGVPIAACTLRDHGWAGLRRTRPGLGIVVLGLIVLPWHVAVSLRHPGFAWDYVVNQHLLFFLDRKLPRDSEGDALGFFWAAFAGRAFPWLLLAPLAAGEAWRGRRRDASATERASFFCGAWLAGTLLVFSLPPSRLEHYALPALPAAALLAARGLGRLHEGEAAAAWAWLGAVGGVLLLVGAGGLVAGRDWLAATYWLTQEPRLLDLVRPAAAAVAIGGALLLAGALARRAGAVVTGLAATGIPLAAVVVVALVFAEPIFSWKPVGTLIRARVPAGVDVVFEAPEEYQLVGGLVFYAGRPVTLLEVAGFVPPTYLAGRMAGMFLPREEFERRWRAGERLVLVSDPQRHRESPDEIVPEPRHVLGRFGDRWVLSSVPAADLS